MTKYNKLFTLIFLVGHFVVTESLSSKVTRCNEVGNISLAARELAVLSRNPNVQLLFDDKNAALSTIVQLEFYKLNIPTQSYNISTKSDREKYCNETKKMLNSLHEIMSFVFSSPRRASKLLHQTDSCELTGRRILFVLLWRGWPLKGADVERAVQHEAMRVVVLSIASPGEFVVFANQASAKHPRKFLPVNVWSARRGGMQHFPVLPRQIDVYRNLRGRFLRIPVLHKPPWYFVEKRNGSLEVIGGRDHQLLNELSKRMNFRYEYLDPPERSQESPLRKNGTSWRGGGVLSLLRYRKVDMFLGDATVTYERTLGLDFSFFTLADSGAFVTHAPRPLSEALVLFRPFQWQVWSAVGVAALLAGPSLHLVTSRPGAARWGSLGDCVWISIAIFLKQSTRFRGANSHKARLLIAVLSISATYVIGDLYCANLTSLLAQPGRERPVRTLGELESALVSRRYELLVERRSSALQFLANGTDEARRLWRLMKRQPRAFVASVERGVALVRASRGLALLAGRETLYFETLRFGLHHFHLSDPLYTRYSAIALQRGCPYLDTIDSIEYKMVKEAIWRSVARLFEAGVLDRMTGMEYARLGRRASEQADQKTEGEQFELQQRAASRPLSVKTLQAAFLALVAGHVVAGAVLVLEVVVHGRWGVAPRPRGARDVWCSERRWKRRVYLTRRAVCEIITQAAEFPREK